MLRPITLALCATLVLLAGCDVTNIDPTGEPVTPPTNASTISPGLPADAPVADSLFQITVVDEDGVPVPDLLVMLRTDLDIDSTSTTMYEDGIPDFELGPVFATPSDPDTPATVRYTLTEDAAVRLFVKDREGRFLAEFGSGQRAAGTYEVAIPFALYDPATPDAFVTPGGLYFIEFEANNVKADIPAAFSECPFLRNQPEIWGWLGRTDASGIFTTNDRARFPSTYDSQPVLEYRNAAGDYGGTFSLKMPVTVVVKDLLGNEATYETTIDPTTVNFFEAVWNP
ncbi:MAG: hypothetical protein AAF089_16730 [Bacteroidota bacterium]